MNFNKNKLAFTLAEVLVTLGVLAVIAAILIPAILQAPAKENKMKFRKAYYTLEKAVQSMTNDTSNYPAEETIVLADGKTYFKGFNYTTATINGTTNKFCYLLSQAMNTTGDVTCPTTAQSGMNYLINFTTTDGVVWGMYFTVTDTATNSESSTTAGDGSSAQFPINANQFETRILIDVNGTKGPNCTLDTNGSGYKPYPPDSVPETTFNYSAACKNPDRFIVGVRYDGKLRAGMSNYSNETVTDQNAIDILSDISKNN